MHVVNKVLDKCILVLAGVAGLALGFLLLAICYSTFSRFVFNKPFSNLIEYSSYCLLYIAFLGGPWLLQQRKHINVDILVTALKPKGQRVMGVVTDLMGFAVCAVIFVVGLRVTIGNIQNNVLVMDSMGTPQWVLIACIPVGTFFMAVQFLRNCAQRFTQANDAVAEGAGES